MSVVLSIGRLVDSQRIQMVTAIGPGGSNEIVLRDANAVSSSEDQIMIPREMALALLEGLTRVFGAAATTDVLSLRKDYDAERARVDTFIAHMIRTSRA
jgi:hypothetical protein